MAILSIQSHVTYGHVGNSAAVFPLQLLGFEVFPIHTVNFSNHAGYEKFYGKIFDGQFVAETAESIKKLGAFSECSALLSGYMGDPTVAEAILQIVDDIKQHNKNALYCCDPVMGDIEAGFYVKPAIANLIMEKAIKKADIVTPNHFELEKITNRTITTERDAAKALCQILEINPKIAVATSLNLEENKENQITVMAASHNSIFSVSTPKLPSSKNFSGTGDFFTALFLGHYLQNLPLDKILEKSVATIFSIIEQTIKSQKNEIQIIHNQNEILSPSKKITVKQVYL